MFSLVIPFHSDQSRLIELRKFVHSSTAPLSEVLLCHNGKFTANSRQWCETFIASCAAEPIPWRLLHTDTPGMGAGYTLGINAAAANWIILSASDLPFGFSDLDAFLQLKDSDKKVAVGSKWHPDSRMKDYPFQRRAASWIYRWIRALVFWDRKLPSDTQGTIIIQSDLAKSCIPCLKETSYLFTLELLLVLMNQGKSIKELPIHFSLRHKEQSSLHIGRDALGFLAGTIRLYWRWPRSKL